MTSLMGVFSSASVVCASARVAATAPMAAVARPASWPVGFFMVCLLGGRLNGHGALLLGSADAGALGIVARDHAHTFATMANIAERPGMEINFVRSLQLRWLPFQGHRASRRRARSSLEFVGLVARYSP